MLPPSELLLQKKKKLQEFSPSALKHIKTKTAAKRQLRTGYSKQPHT
ncbi:MAG: hypothetical protein ACQXXJ_03430 [Candidatus Bathyarchaeia archaeon]